MDLVSEEVALKFVRTKMQDAEVLPWWRMVDAGRRRMKGWRYVEGNTRPEM